MRLDKLETFKVSLGEMELGSGDLLVLCPRGLEGDLRRLYSSLVYTSPLVSINPNMWHT